MNKQHFNNLTPTEAELLALLSEECGELVQAIGKILRHGIDSCHPKTRVSNRLALAKEMGDVFAAMQLITDHMLVHPTSVEEGCQDKLANIQQYLHHAAVNQVSPT